MLLRQKITGLILCLLLSWAALSLPFRVSAALPAGFEIETLAVNMNDPTALAFTGDGRIFIALKDGKVLVYKNGALLSEPLIQLSDVNHYGDRGLIGMAIDPNFSSNGYLYLLYTHENTPGTNLTGPKTGRLVRVTVVGDTADESTKTVILGSVGGTLLAPSCEDYAVTSDCIPSDSPSHSVGGLRFGPDGKLYVSLADGAHYDYVDSRAYRAQNLDSLAGKILRINTDGTAPSNNPFYAGANANRSKVYAYGVRNAFRFNFRPSNNALYAGDVGWASWEEVDKIIAGGNYGWPCREGAGTNEYLCDVNPHIDPLYTYAHNASSAGSITAGAFATAYPSSYANSFFIGDYAQNWIKRVVVDSSDTFVSIENFMDATDGPNGPVSIDRGPDGSIYYIGIYNGSLNRINYTTGNRQPIARLQASPVNGVAPLTVNFSAASSTDPDGNALSYSWSFGDTATSTLVSPSHVYTANGTYTAVLTVTDGHGGTNTKSVPITVGNRAPTATISAPATGSLYNLGDTIQLSGFGSDPEDGTITSASKLSWTVILHHNTHTHTLQTLSGPNPSFPAPDHAGATDVYTEVQLTVTDSGGLSNTKSINLYQSNSQTVSGDLLTNSSFEEAAQNNATNPRYWSPGGWGTNTSTYQYPVAGQSSGAAASVSISSYTNGDAKWYHEPIPTMGSTTYSFVGFYKSNVSNDVLVEYGLGGGKYSYAILGSPLPASNAWTRFERSFTTPANAQTVSVTVPLSQVGQLTVDTFSLVRIGGSAPIDTTAPSVSVTSPSPASTVSGTVLISATSTDNVSVAEVKLLVDSTVVSTNTIAPYSFSWDSTVAPNGTHSVRAVAKDTSGNVATSTTVSVQVLNGVATSSSNLVSNPSVETASANPSTPQDWSGGAWGTNSTTLSYPVAGIDGAKAIQINMSAYTSGDAKWFFKEIPVTPGVPYQYSEYYQATIPTELLIRYTMSNGTYTYPRLQDPVPSSTSWKKLEYTFTPPAGAVSMTAMHLIAGVGTLTTDLYSVTTTAIATSSPNLIANSSFESADNAGNPIAWGKAGWGTNTSSYTYPTAGFNSAKAAKVSITNYTSGDMKWYFTPVAVDAGATYTFSDYYLSTATSEITLQYTMTDGTFKYAYVADVPAAANWTKYQKTVTMPANVKALSVLHLLGKIGELTTDTFSLTKN